MVVSANVLFRKGSLVLRWLCFHCVLTQASFTGTLIPRVRAPPFRPHDLPKAPPPAPWHWAAWFPDRNFGGTQTFTPSHRLAVTLDDSPGDFVCPVPATLSPTGLDVLILSVYLYRGDLEEENLFIY